jgi:hypothetical protein
MPVPLPPGGSTGAPWWVIPEGFLGKLTNALVSGPTLNLYTVTQSAAKPAGAVAGPFATQAEAQTEATAMNQGAVATPGNIATGAGQAAASAAGNLLGLPTIHGAALRPLMVRVIKVVLGLVLVVAGVIQLASPAAATVRKVVPV